MSTYSSSLPEATRMSAGAALRLNAWAAIAVVVAFASRAWLHAAPDPSLVARAGVALLPLVPGALYVRALARWMRSLDEFQRRLQMEAVCIGTLGMLLIALGADLLRSAGITFGTHFGWEGYFALTFLFYAVGLALANRRFR